MKQTRSSKQHDTTSATSVTQWSPTTWQTQFPEEITATGQSSNSADFCFGGFLTYKSNYRPASRGLVIFVVQELKEYPMLNAEAIFFFYIYFTAELFSKSSVQIKIITKQLIIHQNYSNNQLQFPPRIVFSTLECCYSFASPLHALCPTSAFTVTFETCVRYLYLYYKHGCSALIWMGVFLVTN